MNDLEAFKRRVRSELLTHPVITDNRFCEWFARGEADEDVVSDLITQFAVFSNHFLVVQAKRLVNAGSLEAERCARNILVNECGVGLDPRSGSTEGRTFATGNAHLNWLRQSGAALGLAPERLGRWSSATAPTKRFLQGLDRTYGSRDPMVGAGASFAIENWAASGLGGGPEAESKNFWRQLIAGLEALNRRRAAEGEEAVPLAFFKFHAETETGHGLNVWRELEETFSEPGFDEKRFLKGGKKALEAIELFWLGLDAERRRPRRDSVRDALAGVNVAQWAL